MRLYLDTADVAAVRPLAKWGAFAGVTTNPVILAQAGLTPEAAASALAEAQPGDVFVQVLGEDADEVEAAARALADHLPSRLMVKLAPTPVGLEVMRRLKDERIWTAATALFNLGQALLAANAGADILIPFYSRIRQGGGNPEEVIREMVQLCERRKGRPRVLVASVKTRAEVLTVARLGAWAATMPPALAEELVQCEGTDAVLERFAAVGGAGRSAQTVDEE